MLTQLVLGLRSVRRTPLLAVTIIGTLGISLAATVLVFSLLNSFLLQPLPYGDTSRLVVVYEHSIKGGRDNASRVTYGNVVALQERTATFSRTGIFRNESATFHATDSTETAFVQRVTGEIFPMMGAKPAIGSVITPANLEIDGVRTIVLSDSIWRRRFGADPSVVGRTIQLDETLFHVVGVMPADFVVPSGDDNPQAWAALLRTDYDPDERTQRRHHFWGELKPGVSIGAAQADLDRIGAALRDEFPKANLDRNFFAITLRDDLLGNFGQRLVLLQGAVLLVLVVACFNCLCLLIARAIQRRRELAVRLALGASRRHLLVQLFAESLWLSVPAALLALGLAALALPNGMALFPQFVQNNLLTLPQPRLDATVIIVVFASALMIASVFSVIPMFQSRRMNIEAALREGGRSAGSVSGARAARWLASAQIAVALALLISAALLLRSQHRLKQVDVGIPLAQLDQFRVGLRGEAFRDPGARDRFFHSLRDELLLLPGVEAVGTASFLLTQPPGGYQGFTQEGDGLELSETPKRLLPCYVLPGSTEAFGLRLVDGRRLAETDDMNHPPVAVISSSLAEKYWPGESPLGKRIQVETVRSGWLEIVGVVSNVTGLGNQPRVIDTIYVTIAQGNPPGLGMSFFIRRAPGLAIPTDSRVYQETLSRLDPNMQLFGHVSPAETFARSNWQAGFVTQLVVAFALLAVALALAGIYAVNSFLVERRITEFGIRSALGATSQDLRGLVLGDSLRLTAFGLAAGMLLAWAAGKGLGTILFNTAAVDPLVYVAAGLAMSSACAVASLVPAQRAARVDPMIALRSE